MNRTRLLLALASAAVVLTFSSTAFGYNFIYSCGARWESVPVTYYVNQNGSADLGFNTVLSTFENSFNAWQAPCCSSYRATYGGTTSATAGNAGRDIVLSFADNNWDPQFGQVNVTIGVTLVQVLNNCTIYNAPILFNGVGFTFRTNGRATDLESIATHEIGHHLGLGHETQFNGRLPTMYPNYDGATGFRSIEGDDVNGLCALYPGGSCRCSSTSDCVGDFVCLDGTCQEAPCQSDNDCPDGQICQANGDCAPQSCSNDNDCQSGFACSGGFCELCSVCEPCNSNADCGANGICLGELGNRCITYCGQDGQCPGSTICIDGGGAFVCVNPDYQQFGICPDNFECATGTAVNECSFSADCPPGQECVDEDGLGKCRPADDPCFRIFCESGSVCENGNCVDDGSTGNNNTGNNNTGNSNTGGTNNNTSGSGDDEVIILGEPDQTGTDDGCATGGGSATPLALLVGLGLFWRRRRRA